MKWNVLDILIQMQSSISFLMYKVLPNQPCVSFMIHQVESGITNIIEFGIVFKVE